ncbi:MAG: SpoIIE family protein phosphatase [Actinomycetes bacterium]
MEQRFRLGDEPDAVPAARRFVEGALRDTAFARVTREAELVVAELTTNALMYARQPVTVHVDVTVDRVRLEVSDGSHVPPLRALPGTDSMTGRGLALVAAVSDRWGVAPNNGGKVVWAELGGVGTARVDGPNPDIDTVLAGWPDLDHQSAREPRHRIRLGDVPTDLLLGAKAHVDNLVREFTLARSGAESGRTAAISPHLAALIETVTTRFADARQEIKRQALAAAAAGAERTTLVLTLPLSAADAGQEYLAALDEADAYARAARLLTLETPPQHRAFRQWYVAALVNQLRAISEGAKPPPPPTFERHLLDELGIVATARRAADRSAGLQAATASLAGASTPEEVATAVVSQGVAALGASGGALLVPMDDDRLAVPGTVAYDETLIAQLRSERRDAQLPGAFAMRALTPVWVESREERDAVFPALAGLEPTTMAMCAVPLTLAGRALGALRFSFDTSRLFDEDERRFVLALAAQTAHALDRSQLHQSEHHARDQAETAARRLTRLHQVTTSLASASEADEIAKIATGEAAATLGARVAMLSELDEVGTTLRLLGASGTGHEVEKLWASTRLDADLPSSAAVRTNRAVLVGEESTGSVLDTGPIPLASRDRQPAPGFDRDRSDDGPLVSVPLSAGQRTLGALTLTFPPGHVVDDAEVEVLTIIGRQCGLALERARLFAAERAARERSTFLADATALLGSSLEPEQTLRHLTGLLVPSMADWAVVYLVDRTGRVEAAAAQHRSPGIARTMRRLQPNRPLDVDATGGLGEVLRTGQSLRYDQVPEEIRSCAARYLEGTGVAVNGEDGPESGLGVPLVARGRVFGALALVRVEGTPYTDDELRLVEQIAARAAVAIDNAEQYGRERDAALTLQRSLLPQRLPKVDGVALAWRYLPGSAGTHIGGDWYDVIPVENGLVALVIGDVMGRGLQAAALMGQLRATARAHASAHLEPAAVLARLDAALAPLEQEQITTAVFGLLDPTTRTVTMASAGHLPPLVVPREGEAYYLDVTPGPPLGAGEPTYPQLRATLPPSSTLLLYTDGLVEDRRRAVDRGLEALRVAAATADGPESLCDRALAALGRDTAHEDDTAVLAVHLL